MSPQPDSPEFPEVNPQYLDGPGLDDGLLLPQDLPDALLEELDPDMMDRRAMLRRLGMLGLGAIGLSSLGLGGCIALPSDEIRSVPWPSGSGGRPVKRPAPEITRDHPMSHSTSDESRRREQRAREEQAARARRTTERVPAKSRATRDPLDAVWGQVIGRNRWTSQAPIRSRLNRLGKIQRITVHHDGMPTPNWSTAWRDVVADLQLIRKGHLKRMRAGDIGYHFLVDRQGRIWEGRPLQFQGAHVKDRNPGNLGITVLGNYEKQKPTRKSVESLNRLLLASMRRFRVPPTRVHTHRELANTVCPGRELQPWIDKIRQNWA